ncbi:MAG: aminoglycoside phosphotransferase family protein [Candidatus Roizmanbacteria bacterium]|nr:aminoglycoside phosphotransferase family protein [Candidatus Roizmanbacteria bacterium]
MSKKMTEYEKFLQKRHSQFNTDQELIKHAVKYATESSIEKQERIVGGEANEVYKISTLSNKQIYVKIMHDRKYPLLREKWAIDQCKKYNVPVPQIQYVKQMKRNGKLLTISVQEEVEGIPLSTLEKSDPSEKLHHYTILAGKTLAKIHSILTKGYGKINGNGEGYYRTNSEAMQEPLESIDDIEKASDRAKIDVQLVHRLIQEYKQSIVHIGTIMPRLLHHDYGIDHIFIKNHAISGIIDFGDCGSGDPVLDLVRWTYFTKPKFPVQLLIEGYEQRVPIKKLYEKRRRVYLIYLNLQHLLYYYWDNNVVGLAHVKKKIEELQ